MATETFYPDAHPETSSVDGAAYYATIPAGGTWANLIAGTGGGAGSYDDMGIFSFTFQSYSSNWWVLDKPIILFDTSALPTDCTITSATLSLYYKEKASGFTFDPEPDVCIYSSAPASDTSLTGADYTTLGTTKLSDTSYDYDDFTASQYYDYALNADGLAAISKTGATKFGLRMSHYDVAENEPNWTASAGFGITFYAADAGGGYRPKLVVNYTGGSEEEAATTKSYDIKFLNQTTAIKTQAESEATTVYVDSTTGIVAEEAISIVLDDDNTHWDIIVGVTAPDTVEINSGIPLGRNAPVDAVVKTYYAYMCRQHDQVKDWLVTEAPLLPQTILTESASPSSISPEREIQISQVDWRKGIGNFILEDEHKYHDSYRCDARYKGQVILSPLQLSALSAPGTGAKAIQDAGMEAWDDASNLTYWTKTGGGVLDRDTGSPYSGTYAAKLRGYSSNEEIYQDLPFHSQNKGKEFTLKAWCKITTGVDSALIGIDDGVDVTWSSEITNTTYAQISVSRTLSASATRLRIRCYTAEASNPAAYFWVDDVTTEATTPNLGSYEKIIEFGSDILVASGPSLLKISGSDLVVITDFPATITDLAVFENRLYIAQGWDDEYFYTSDLATFIECTLSDSTAKYMSAVGSQFWISDSNSTMTDSDNPINGGTAFATPSYQVGSDDWDITGLVDHNEIVFCRKEDDIYYLSGSDVYSLLNLSTEASITYTYGLHLWGGYLYIPSGVNSLYEYDISSGVATVISPVKYSPVPPAGDPSYSGEITAVCHDETYLYCTINDGSYSRILAGRWENVEGDTDWYWQPLYYYDTNDMTTMLISSFSGDKRLYAGYDSYSDGIDCFFVPITYSGYLESDIGDFRYEPTGTFATSWLTSNFPTEQKYWKSIDVTSVCVTDLTSLEVRYQVKGGSWVSLGYCTTSALDAGDYPDELTDSFTIGVSSERIRFLLLLKVEDDDYTPVLYGATGGYVTYAVLQADRKKQIEATIQVAPTITERNRSAVTRTVSSDLTNLRSLYDAKTGMEVTGPDGTVYNTVFARDGYKEQLAYDELKRLENWWVTVKLLEV